MPCIVNRIRRTVPRATEIPVELIYRLVRALAERVSMGARLKQAVFCLALVAGLGLLAATVAETAPVPPQAVSAAAPESGQGAGTSGASGASGAPVEVRELWTGSLYSSTYRVGVCISAQGTVRGVVPLRLYNGKVDVYHIDGTVLNNDIEAHHSSGHKFKGRLVSADSVEGVISLKNGMNVRLEGKRAHGVELAPEDCAPLPQ